MRHLLFTGVPQRCSPMGVTVRVTPTVLNITQLLSPVNEPVWMYMVLQYHGAKPHVCLTSRGRFASQRCLPAEVVTTGGQRWEATWLVLYECSQRGSSTGLLNAVYQQCQSTVLITSERHRGGTQGVLGEEANMSVRAWVNGMLGLFFRLGGHSQSVSNSDYSRSIVEIGEKYLKPKLVGATTKLNQYSIQVEAVYQLCGFRCV